MKKTKGVGLMTRSEGEEYFAQGFQFTKNVPTEDQGVIRDYLYKFAHNYLEALEYLQILKQLDELDYEAKDELLFRIQAMALQCFPLAMRRMTDKSSRRSLRKLINKIIKDEFKQNEIDKIETIYSHYCDFLDKGVAHQDDWSIKQTLSSFPDTDIIEHDLVELRQLYEKIVLEICTKYINIAQVAHDYARSLSKLKKTNG